METSLFPQVSGLQTSIFPNWQNPDPTAYTWTMPPSSWWHQLFGGGAIGDVVNFLSSMGMAMNSMFLRISILFTSFFSDPSWLTEPLASQIGNLFSFGYQNVFMRYIPILFTIVVGYVVWNYIKGNTAKVLRAIASTVLSSILIFLFFFNFSSFFAWINQTGDMLTTDLATSVAATAGTNVSSEYDALWDAYVLYPWEYGQFGETSTDLSDFNASKKVAGSTYQTDSGAPATMTTSSNWVQMFLQNTTPDARSSLAQVLDGDTQPAIRVQATLPKNVNLYTNLLVIFFEFWFLIPVIVFLVYLGFQLFIREVFFLYTAFMGIITVPMSFVPEIGWTVTMRWVREGIGHLVERLANVIYGALLFSLSGLITSFMTLFGGGGLIGAMMINAMLFGAAIFYRSKVFSIWVHPMADRVRYGKKAPGEEAEMEQNTQKRYSREQQMDEELHGTKGKRREGRHLAERFAHIDEVTPVDNRSHASHEKSRKLKKAAVIAAQVGLAVATDGASLAVEGAAEGAALEEGAMTASKVGSEAGAMKGSSVTKPQGQHNRLSKIGSLASRFIEPGNNSHHTSKDTNKINRAYDWEERARRREERIRRLENGASDLAVAAIKRYVRRTSRMIPQSASDEMESDASTMATRFNNTSEAEPENVQREDIPNETGASRTQNNASTSSNINTSEDNGSAGTWPTTPVITEVLQASMDGQSSITSTDKGNNTPPISNNIGRVRPGTGFVDESASRYGKDVARIYGENKGTNADIEKRTLSEAFTPSEPSYIPSNSTDKTSTREETESSPNPNSAMKTEKGDVQIVSGENKQNTLSSVPDSKSSSGQVSSGTNNSSRQERIRRIRNQNRNGSSPSTENQPTRSRMETQNRDSEK